MAIHLSYMQQMAAAAYNKNPPAEIGGFKLLEATPTLKFYNSGKIIVVAVRGTDDARDFAAWHLVALGQLDNSPRFQEDLRTIMEFQIAYPRSEYSYIGVGHSLGGAIIDRFLRMGFLRRALSYNAAPEPQELRGNPAHRRIYHEDDPLYKIAGRFIPGIEVRKSRDPFWLKYLRNFVPLGIANAYNAIIKHKLPTFEGGATRREKFLKANKLEDRSYSLKELANISKVPLKILREVYNRGIGAYKTQPGSVRLKGSYVKNVNAPMSAKLSKEQWAYARVYSFLNGNPKHDEDLRRRGGMGCGPSSIAVAPAPQEEEEEDEGEVEEVRAVEEEPPPPPPLPDEYAEMIRGAPQEVTDLLSAAFSVLSLSAEYLELLQNESNTAEEVQEGNASIETLAKELDKIESLIAREFPEWKKRFAKSAKKYWKQLTKK